MRPDEEHLRIAGHREWQTAAHLGKVGALGDDVDGSGFDAGQIEDAGERNAFPDGVADGIVAPRRAGRQRFEAGASVSRTFEEGLDLARTEVTQIIEREGLGSFDIAGDVEPPAPRVENGDRSVRADEEPVVGNDAAPGGLDEVEWHPEVCPTVGNEPLIFAEGAQQVVGRGFDVDERALHAKISPAARLRPGDHTRSLRAHGSRIV